MPITRHRTRRVHARPAVRFRPALRSPGSGRPELQGLEERRMLSGVTLITHGFNGNVDGWVTAMADAIANRPDVAIDALRYTVTVEDPGSDGGPLDVTAVRTDAGPAPDDPTLSFPEILILLEWTDVAGELPFGGSVRSTIDVGAAVADALLAPGLLPDVATSLTELPFHLIGHSRGAGLVGEIAKNLGEAGAWVDQVTTNDPHPVDGVREPFPFPDYGDAPMQNWENIAFWDNYWRIEQGTGCLSFDFCGESISGAYDLQLSEDLLEDAGGYGFEHSDTHLFYHGTIDTSPDAFDGEEAVPAAFYNAPHPARDATGYLWSRIVGEARPAEGVGVPFGGQGARDSVTRVGAQWPNVGAIVLGGADAPLAPGDVLDVTYLHQDADSASTVRLLLDDDRNPFNGFTDIELDEQTFGSTGTTIVERAASWAAPTRTDGTFHVVAAGDGRRPDSVRVCGRCDRDRTLAERAVDTGAAAAERIGRRCAAEHAGAGGSAVRSAGAFAAGRCADDRTGADRGDAIRRDDDGH
jgi:hypothetical protein